MRAILLLVSMASLICAGVVDNRYLPAVVPPSSNNDKDVGNVILLPPDVILTQSPKQDDKQSLEFTNLVHTNSCAGCNQIYKKIF
ncbi:hypothetical protein HUJ04_005929 [Dendroctonus ponderosae]|nr:hypothetical protein HUJ04_005929 [Dendroctonus ponderosae]KAH1004952.1 hypothetical protein HUJ05_005713 [Dendroctonus ponderosae]